MKGRLSTGFSPLLVCLVLLLNSLPGKAQTTFVEEGGRSMELVISPDFTASMRIELSEWAWFVSRSLLQVYGRWPRDHWRITVAPASATGDDPIPWAQVHRDDIDTVEFFVSPLASTAMLNRAWTSYHELAHLLIPYRGWGDAWFSEGPGHLLSKYSTGPGRHTQ